jgi:hypothetical protein
MSLFAVLAATLALAGPAAPGVPPVTVTVDSARHEVVVSTGPWNLPNMPPMDHAMMDMGADAPLQRFAWPVDGWFRGFKYELVDEHGTVLDRRIMHHMIMVNFDRRQLLYHAIERLAGAGSETDDASVPKTIGVPLSRGADLGFYIMWHNETGQDLHGVYLKYTMLWTPTNQNPRPVTSLPIYMDVNLTVGGSNTFDAPPGHTAKSWEFTLPISGRLLGVGGHLHDYGTMVRLEDAETGKELARVVARRDSSGRVLGVSRKLFGVSGEGLKLKAGHRYRVVGLYDNPSNKTEYSVMAHMVGLFVPDNMAEWPKVDTSDPTLRKDLASLHVPGYGDAGAGAGAGGGDHMHMDHGGMDHGGMNHDGMERGNKPPEKQ